jgi:hypothetical protein
MNNRPKSIIRVQSWAPTRLFLFVNLITSILIVLSAGAVSLGYSIGSCLGVIFIGTFALGLGLAVPIPKLIVDWRACLAVAIGMAATLYLLWPAILSGSMTSIFPDASNYVAFAQYLFRYPRSLAHGLSPIYQYASIFSHSRFATAALLGIIANFLHGDAGLALIPFSAVASFNIFAGFATLARQLGCAPFTAVLTGVFSVVCGWVPDMYAVGSLDNLLFVALLPFLLVRLPLTLTETANSRSAVACGICCAAAFYTYPEGLAIAGVTFFPLFVTVLIRALLNKSALIRLAVTGGVAIILSLPYVSTFYSFLAQQLTELNEPNLGRGIFPGLISRKFFPALFGFGEEFGGTPFRWQSIWLSGILLILILFGMIRLRRLNRALAWSFLVFIGLAVWQGVQKQFSYGLYKVLTIGSVVLFPAIFLGLDTLCHRLNRTPRSTVTGVLACILVVFSSVEVYRDYNLTPKRFHVPLKPYSDLRKIGAVTHGLSLSLMCDNDVDQEWALIYLGDQPQELRFQRGSQALPWVKSVMLQARKEVNPVKFFLLNRRMSGSTWSNSKFWLVPFSEDCAPITIAETPNGVEEIEGSAFTWLSDRPTSFAIDSPLAGPAVLFSKKVRLGPSKPDDSARTVVVRDLDGIHEQKVTDLFYTLVQLKCGLNYVDLSCAEKPSLKVLPNGDSRVLMIGLQDYQVRPVRSAVQLIDILHAPNVPELLNGVPLLWLSNEPATFLIFSLKEQRCLFQADKAIAGPSNQDLAERTLAVKLNGAETRFSVAASFSNPFLLRAGLNRMDVWCDDPPLIRTLANGDSRILLLGLLNYRVTEAGP